MYSITLEKVIWTYTKKQIEELFKAIQDREIKEINRTYNMIRASMSRDAPDKFIAKKESINKEGKSLENMGIGSDEKMKNHNPNLKVED